MDYKRIEPSNGVYNETTTTTGSSRMLRKHVYSMYVPNKRWSRYTSAINVLKPIRFEKNENLSVTNAGLFNFVTFTWILKYLWMGLRKDAYTIPVCPKSESAGVNSPRLDGLLQLQTFVQGNPGASVVSVLWKFIRTRMMFCCFLYVCANLFSVIGLVIFIPRILERNKIALDIPTLTNLILFGLMELASYFLYAASSSINIRTALRLRSACFSSVFRHSMLTLLTYQLSSWKLISFLMYEGQQVYDLVIYFPHLICSPIIILFCILFIGIQLEIWLYASCIIILLILPVIILVIIALLSRTLLHKANIFSDQRVKYIEDFIVHNIYVKYFQKEAFFEDKIRNKRQNELRYMQYLGFYDKFCSLLIQIQPLLLLTVLFIEIEFHREQLTNIHKIAAVAIIILVHIKQSLDNFWQGLNSFIKGISTLEKYKEVKRLDTVNSERKKRPSDDLAINIKEASFQWIKDIGYKNRRSIIEYSSSNVHLSTNKTYDVLHEITMTVAKGAFIGVCGQPGSGKSSLLLAMMGLLLKSEGDRETNGSFAYVSQEPCIFYDTFKENILFGSKFDPQKYYNVIDRCELKDDVTMLPGNDETMIDSSLLSLAQKQRIALARVLYSDRDIYLLDNPLSALDHDTKKNIFHNAILTALENKTVVLVSNNYEFLQHCHQIYMLKDGKLLLDGPHSELVLHNEYYDLIDHYEKENHMYKDKSDSFEVHDDTSIILPINDSLNSYTGFHSDDSINYNNNSQDIIKLTQDSDNILRRYLSNFGKMTIFLGFLTQLLNSFLISLFPVFFIFSLQYLIHGLMWLIIYFCLFLFVMMIGTIINYFFNKNIITSAMTFHNDMLNKLYKASLFFVQSKSLNIISTISLHLNLTDIEIPHLSYNILLQIFFIFLTSGVLALVSIWYIIYLVSLAAIIILLNVIVCKSLLYFNEHQMNSIISLYSQVVVVLKSRPVIQSFDRVDDFLEKFYDEYDKYIVYTYIINAVKYWINLIIQILSACSIVAVGYWALQFHELKIMSFFTMETIGFPLSILCILQICFAAQKLTVLYIDTILAFDVLSRVKTSVSEDANESETNENEGWVVDESLTIKFNSVTVHKLNKGILFTDLSLDIKPREKIGILGLTIAERSGFIATLYRMLTLSNGTIHFGSTNITKIPLNKLRSCISVVPSEPYLFREKISDFLNTSNMAEVSDILQRLFIWENVYNKWDAVIEQHLGREEKQLLCLAQAYIMKSKVIIIEDFLIGSRLENIVKRFIRDLFPTSIIIVFSNDVYSLIKCDRVLEFENHKICREETPKVLINELKSTFKSSIANLPETPL